MITSISSDPSRLSGRTLRDTYLKEELLKDRSVFRWLEGIRDNLSQGGKRKPPGHFVFILSR